MSSHLIPKGARVRMDMLGGNRIQQEADRAPTGHAIRKRATGHRYCEACDRMRPANAQPHVKGWRCDTCR